MTKKEITDFLHDKYQCKKTDMRTIKDMVEVASSVGYNVIKQGVDNFDLCEKGIIMDFTKPIKLITKLPDGLPVTRVINGIPVPLLCEATYFGRFNPELYAYLVNKKDGEHIHFNELLILKIAYCKDLQSIIWNLDELTFSGYLKEQKDCIEVYIYPYDQSDTPLNYRMQEVQRFAPYKYLD